ncbi:MAG TPA: FHA domain-containing protein [Candidatus Anaerobutyricum faecale]|mgnify:CR=1 FL=1|nr:FHA domain-containing protein [Candidatus Anaerobutyricum faecale]
MSILSQIGIVVLIGCIIFILIRSNKTLKEASEEGEQFVDEWALRQQKKEERALEKEERRQEKEERLRDKKERKKNKKELLYDDEEEWEEDRWNRQDNWNRENDWDADNDSDQEDDWNREESWNAADENRCEDGRHRDGGMRGEMQHSGRRSTTSREKIISMDQYKNTGITLVQLDEGHRPAARVRVTKLPFTIGRSEENMLVLDDLCVARKHCRIVEQNGTFILEDVGTANKIFAGGAITDHVVLADQSTFYIGNVEFRVEMSMSRSGHTHLYQGAGERYYE